MSKFPKKKWDKTTTNFDESLTIMLKDKCHHSIYNFIMGHMAKLGAMLVKQKAESTTWEGSIRPKIKKNVILNITKSMAYPVNPLTNGVFRVFIGKSIFNVDIMNRTCSCKDWKMLGIPCEHACAALLSTSQNIFCFVEDYFNFPNQELIYFGSFSCIETHDMPRVDNDGVVRDFTGRIFFSLDSPHPKCPLGRPRRKRVESQVMDERTIYCY